MSDKIIVHVYKERIDGQSYELWDEFYMDGRTRSGSETLHIYREESVDGKLHRGLHPEQRPERLMGLVGGNYDSHNKQQRVYWYEKKVN